MEENYLSSLLRVKQQMSPVRETFPGTYSPGEKPVFKFSYNYLRAVPCSPITSSPKKTPVKAKSQKRRAKDCLKPPETLIPGGTQPPTAGSSFRVPSEADAQKEIPESWQVIN